MDERKAYKSDGVVKETERAYLIDFFGEEIWLPKSQVDISEKEDGHVWVFIPDWLAEKNNL